MVRSSFWTCWILITLLLGGGMSGVSSVHAQDDEDPSLQKELAEVDSLRTAREFRSALARLDELARDYDESIDVLWRQSILWSDLGKEAGSDSRSLTFYRQALTVAETALETDAESAWAHTAKAVSAGRIANLTGSNKTAIRLSRDVKNHIDRALELDSTLAAAHHVRARWHREVSDLNFVQRMVVKTVYGGLPTASIDQAVEDFQTAIELERRTYHHLELGKTYQQMGRTEAAREQLQIAIDMPWGDPFDPEYKREARKLLEDL